MDGNATKGADIPSGLNDLLREVLNPNDHTKQDQIRVKSNSYLHKQIQLVSPNHSRDDLSTASKGGIWRMSNAMMKKSNR